MSTVYKTVKAKLVREEKYNQISFSGHVTVTELIELIEHHSTRDLTVSAGILGLTTVKPASAAQNLKAEWTQKRLERLTEKTGREPEANIVIYETEKPSGMTHSILFHGAYAFTDETREQFFPVD